MAAHGLPFFCPTAGDRARRNQRSDGVRVQSGLHGLRRQPVGNLRPEDMQNHGPSNAGSVVTVFGTFVASLVESPPTHFPYLVCARSCCPHATGLDVLTKQRWRELEWKSLLRAS